MLGSLWKLTLFSETDRARPLIDHPFFTSRRDTKYEGLLLVPFFKLIATDPARLLDFAQTQLR